MGAIRAVGEIKDRTKSIKGGVSDAGERVLILKFNSKTNIPLPSVYLWKLQPSNYTLCTQIYISTAKNTMVESRLLYTAWKKILSHS